jgi:hypothetical protein
MGSGEKGRLLIYTHLRGLFAPPVPPEDLIEVTASLQDGYSWGRVGQRPLAVYRSLAG